MNFPTFEQYIQCTVYAMLVYSVGVTLIIAAAAKICMARNIHKAELLTGKVVVRREEDPIEPSLFPDAVSYDHLRKCVAERTRKLQLASATMHNTRGILQLFYELKPEEQRLAPVHYLNRAICSNDAAVEAMLNEDFDAMLKHSVQAFLAIERVQAALWHEHKIFCLMHGQEMPAVVSK
ncbi:MAG: hypothetical protein K2X81_06585 [Candidatus Obscuribacterales bacterium]|nr:hypothetical protein [Candidatus Obscuribacterales bacterium]